MKSRKPKLKFPRKVGTFRLGHINVELFATNNEGGGAFACWPDRKSPPQIRVDIDYSDWDDCVGTLLHEAFELEMSLRDLRFKRSGTLNSDSGDNIFIMNHCDFGQVCNAVSTFIVPALPLLADVYNKFHRKD